MHILFVCTGNTCRSPMAEGILNAVSSKNTATSCGLYVFAPTAASNNAILVTKDKGIDISGHISKQITKEKAEEADLILTMTSAHKNALLELFPFAKDKTFTLSEYAKSEGDILDPFGGDLEIYKACADSIYSLIKEADL